MDICDEYSSTDEYEDILLFKTDSSESDSGDDEIEKCVVSGKNFKVSEHELEICNFFGINPPNKCYDVRRNELLANFDKALSNYF